MGTREDGAIKHGQNNGNSAQQLQPSSCARLVALAQDRSTPEELGAWLKVPLEHAAAVGDKDLTTQLVLAGASGDPMTAAIKGGQQGLVQHLLVVHSGEILRRGDGEDEHIRLAARLGHAPMVSLLLEHGVDVDRRAAAEEGCESALDFAAVGGHAEAISVIAQHGGPEIVNATSETTGYSALHHAAKHDQERSIDALIEGGAQLELEDDEGYTPLHVAATFDSEAAIRALIRHGADIESTTHNHLTPVMLAIQKGHRIAVTTLVAAGADINSQDGGKSVLEHAVETAGIGYANSQQDGADPSVGPDALERRIDLVRTLLQHGARAGDASAGGFTPLHWAAWFDLAPVIGILVEAGADLEAKLTGGGDTPLHGAATNAGSIASINALVSHGANIHARKTPCGKTPLHKAAEDWRYAQSPATVDALLKAGADETILDAAGLMPVQLVGSAGDTDVARSEVELVRSLLTNAPRDRADRAWSRRALFVLCRAFPDRVRLESPDNGGDERSQPAVAGEAASHHATIPVKRSRRGGCLGRISQEMRSSLEAAGGFRTAMGRLIGLQEDCIFREIMGFL